MPGMDKTGPFGTGSMGRGVGPCKGGLVTQPGYGGRMGRGFRHGGLGGCFPPVVSTDEEKAFLEERKNWLKSQIEAVDNQLENLKKPEE